MWGAISASVFELSKDKWSRTGRFALPPPPPNGKRYKAMTSFFYLQNSCKLSVIETCCVSIIRRDRLSYLAQPGPALSRGSGGGSRWAAPDSRTRSCRGSRTEPRRRRYTAPGASSAGRLSGKHGKTRANTGKPGKHGQTGQTRGKHGANTGKHRQTHVGQGWRGKP